MKRILYYILILPLIFVSCYRNDDDLFEQSAAERMAKVKQELTNILTSAPNGWELLYFPNAESAGYALLCKFNANGTVTFAGKNAANTDGLYKEATSTWNIDNTQSTILTFDTYNSVFSVFADPSSDGIGYNGDYEFLIQSYNDEQVKLKGKKHSAYVKLVPLSQSQDWKEYFNAVDDVYYTTYLMNDSVYMLYDYGNDLQLVLQQTNGMFEYIGSWNSQENSTFTINDINPGSSVYEGFVITPTGIYLYWGLPTNQISWKDYESFMLGLSTDKSVVINGLADRFIFNEDKTKLICPQYPEVSLSNAFTPATFVDFEMQRKGTWLYSDENTDFMTISSMNTIKKAASDKGAVINNIGYALVYTQNNLGISTATYTLYISYLVEGKLFEGHLNLNCNKTNVNNGKLTFSYANSYTESLSPLFARLADTKDLAIKMFTDIFCDTFEPQAAGSNINLMQLYFVSTTNANKKIYLKGNHFSR